MKHYILFTVLCISFLIVSPIYAQEPILVINPHGHSSGMENIMFTPDGKTLISTSHDKTVRLWDAETGDLIKTLRHQIGAGHEGEIHGAALSPDGKILAIGGISDWNDARELLVYLFDLEGGNVLGILGGHPDVVMELEFSPDGKWLASGSGNYIRIWNMAKIGAGPALILESESELFDLAFSPDGKKLTSGHVDGAVRIWELPEDLQGVQNLEGLKPEKVMKKHETVACCIDWSPDGKYIVSGDFNGQYLLWDAKKSKVKKKFKPTVTSAAIAFSADSKHVAISNGSQVEVYSVPKLKKKLTFEKHASPVTMSAFSNNVTAIAFHGNDLVATAEALITTSTSGTSKKARSKHILPEKENGLKLWRLATICARPSEIPQAACIKLAP